MQPGRSSVIWWDHRYCCYERQLPPGKQALISIESIEPSWKDKLRQREELARMLLEPLALLARRCIPVWDDRDRLNEVLL